MNTNPILIAAAALTLLTACRPDDLAMESIDDLVPVRLAYTTVSATETRAAQNLNEDVLAGGEAVHVRISPMYDSIWADYTFTADADGTLTTTGTPPYYPAGSQNINIVAFCPDLGTYSYTTTFAIPIDQRSDAAYRTADLLYASVTNQGKQAAPVTLHFVHKTAKLCVNVTAGEGIASIYGIGINQVKTAASFNILTGQLGNATAPSANITVSNNGAACIPPQTITGDLLSVVTDQGIATYSVPDGKTFEAGKEYTMNITINRRAVGAKTPITGWTDEGTVTIAGPKAVDLGLGVKWANMNVGATSETDFGEYFAWGDVRGHSGNDVDDFDANHYYLGQMGSGGASYSIIYMYNATDGLTVLKPSHDAATVHWGDGWRMPTKEEFEALLTLDKEWTVQDEVNGYRFTGNGNSIFLPAAGFYGFSREDDDYYVEGISRYWSSSRTSLDYAFFLEFSEGSAIVSNDHRHKGLPIRPVRSSD